jgi:hypothetical protein
LPQKDPNERGGGKQRLHPGLVSFQSHEINTVAVSFDIRGRDVPDVHTCRGERQALAMKRSAFQLRMSGRKVAQRHAWFAFYFAGCGN